MQTLSELDSKIAPGISKPIPASKCAKPNQSMQQDQAYQPLFPIIGTTGPRTGREE